MKQIICLLLCLLLLCPMVGCVGKTPTQPTASDVPFSFDWDALESVPASSVASAPSVPASSARQISSAPARSAVSAVSRPETAADSMPAAYQALLNAYVQAFPWGDDPIPGVPDASYMYFFYDSLSDVGYTLKDVDGNGQPELMIGEAYTIVDFYTLQNGQAVHVFSGGERSTYRLRSDGLIYHYGSGGAVSGVGELYRYQNGQLVCVDRVIVDGSFAQESGLYYEQDDQWGGSYYFTSPDLSNDYWKKPEDYVPLSREEGERRLKEWQNSVIPMNYTPLSEFA